MKITNILFASLIVIGTVFLAFTQERGQGEDQNRGGELRTRPDTRDDFWKAEMEMRKSVSEGKIFKEDDLSRLGALRERMGQQQNRGGERAGDSARSRERRSNQPLDLERSE